MEHKKQLLIRAVFIGDTNIGKTSLILREINNTFLNHYVSTIGTDFWFKDYIINYENIKGQMWDSTSVQRRFFMRSAFPTFFRKMNLFGLCFDLNDRSTFDLIKQWTSIVKTGNPTASCFLIGCKSDLDHKIDKGEIAKICQQFNLIYLETSSKENKGVKQAFIRMMEAGQANVHKQATEASNTARSKYTFSFCKT